MSQKDVHTSYYAIDPREVGDVVEKSGKNRPCDAKCGKSERFLGERATEAVATPYVRSTYVLRKGLIGRVSLLTGLCLTHSNDRMPKWRNWQTR